MMRFRTSSLLTSKGPVGVKGVLDVKSFICCVAQPPLSTRVTGRGTVFHLTVAAFTIRLSFSRFEHLEDLIY